MADLATLQRLFHNRVTAGASADGLAVSGELAIYARMYASRLHDTLAEDYPKLLATLGEDEFARVAAAYFHDLPPRSFTLRDAGLELPDFLRRTDTRPWSADLAALERARVEVFDGAEARPLAQSEVAELGYELPDLLISWVPSSEVVPIEWAVDDLWSAIEDGEPAFEPARADRVVLVWRRDIAVVHRTLDADEAELAPQIAVGARFADVCEGIATTRSDDPGPRAAELLLRWLEAEVLVAPTSSTGS